MGHAFNPFTIADEHRCTQELIAASRNHDALLNALDKLSGRFVVMMADRQKFWVFPDAGATLPVHYVETADGPRFASHYEILKRVLHLRDDPAIAELRRSRCYKIGITLRPADQTRVEGVRVLTPNVALQVDGARITHRRIFPRQPRRPISTEQAIAEASRLLAASAAYLVNREWPVLCALTGGVDSRITLAALRSHCCAVRFFTSPAKATARIDVRANAVRDLNAAKALQARLGILHEVFEPADADDASWPVELRSSISEITRCFFRRKFRLRQAATPSALVMAAIYKRFPPWSKWCRFLEHAFDEWSQRIELNSVQSHGYDWLDILYWEHRVGTWQSRVLQGRERFARPLVLFNNRRLLTLLLATPEEDRLTDRLHSRLIEAMWPEAMSVPFVKNFAWLATVREIAEGGYLRLYLSARDTRWLN